MSRLRRARDPQDINVRVIACILAAGATVASAGGRRLAEAGGLSEIDEFLTFVRAEEARHARDFVLCDSDEGFGVVAVLQERRHRREGGFLKDSHSTAHSTSRSKEA